MNGTAYNHRAAIQACVIAARILSQHNFPDMLDAILRAETLGPIFPTLYMDKSKAMVEDREILQAALPLWRVAKRFSDSEPVVV